MILDLHTHTSEHSPCGRQTAEELILRASEVGLDGIVITDHDHLWDRNELAAVLKRVGTPLHVLRGQEVSCSDGHLLVYGVDEPVTGDAPRATIAQRVQARGGATVLAHPFRWEGFAGEPDEAVAAYFQAFEGVEAWTTNHTEAATKRAEAFGAHPRIRLTGASDAHVPDRVGLYATRFERRVRNEAELAKALASGAFSPVQRVETGGFTPCRLSL
jgi:hypothetical protein